MVLNSKVPDGPIQDKWEKRKFELKLVNPANKRKYKVIVVGTGLAGASAAASLADLGYNVVALTIHDSPRRAHSIAAQGGINAAKNYPNDGDSIWRLFYDTVKGGDYRAREANVYRLAQVSNAIIDQCVAQGVPFAREYNGELANRSFGGAQVSRTFYAKGQTGQQLLLGAYGAMMKHLESGGIKLFCRREMLDLVLVDGKARGVVCRNLVDGKLETYVGDAVLLCTGGYARAFYLSTNAMNSNATAIWRCHKKGAFFANPCFTQIHPTCIPVSGSHQSKLVLMSESLRNDGRVWVPKRKEDVRRHPNEIAVADRDYFLERRYPSFGNLVPRDVASRASKQVCDEGRGVYTGRAVYLDFDDAIKRFGQAEIEDRYGNLFSMYAKITGQNPYEVPMMIYPAVHYTMGGLWVDYDLMSTIQGLFILGEANFSDHGANRLGASALMQGLADGYFVAPYTVGNYLATNELKKLGEDHAEFRKSVDEINGAVRRIVGRAGKAKKTVNEVYRELGEVMWENVGMGRNENSLKTALKRIPELRAQFQQEVGISGSGDSMNKQLEMYGRVADFLELAELLAHDALERRESCGGHFREESHTEDGEAKRDDENFSYVAAWEHKGVGQPHELHKEPLKFEYVKLAQRSYK